MSSGSSRASWHWNAKNHSGSCSATMYLGPSATRKRWHQAWMASAPHTGGPWVPPQRRCSSRRRRACHIKGRQATSGQLVATVTQETTCSTVAFSVAFPQEKARRLSSRTSSSSKPDRGCSVPGRSMMKNIVDVEATSFSMAALHEHGFTVLVDFAAAFP